MEYWNLFDYEGKKKKKLAIRGTKLADDDFHLVVNVWIMNDNGEFLITQRAVNKSHPLMWECTGGSSLINENSKQAAIREVKEELGIDISKSEGTLIGRTRRYYANCPDILDVWLFKSNISLKEVVIQKEEVNDVMFASREKIKKLFDNGQFEANALFNRVVDIENKSEVYYVGFNANNAICNENFFSSITLNPNREKGNIYYKEETIEEKNSDSFLKEYKNFLIETMTNLTRKNANTIFLAFNKKINNLLKNQKQFNIIHDNYELLDKLNNKKFARELVKSDVPVIKTCFIEKNISYEEATRLIKSKKIVIQGKTVAGGNNTYYVDNFEKFNKYKEECDNKYFLSKYIKHLPVNITLVIGKYETISLPLSVQLIKLTDDRFKYVGADFIYSQTLNNTVTAKIRDYTSKIIKKLKEIDYKGIVGVDYVIDSNDNVYFMELNPRFQASSFIINKYLEKYCSTCLAELHYLAITDKCIGNNYLDKIDKSFVNCYNSKDYDEYKYAKRVVNGYYAKNKDSYYRKVFNYSILKNSEFEKRAKDM